MVQVSMKQEMELAMKLLEKDIHEKQDTLIGLRQQLDEVKAINVEMYQKMQVHLLPVPPLQNNNRSLSCVPVVRLRIEHDWWYGLVWVRDIMGQNPKRALALCLLCLSGYSFRI